MNCDVFDLCARIESNESQKFELILNGFPQNYLLCYWLCMHSGVSGGSRFFNSFYTELLYKSIIYVLLYYQKEDIFKGPLIEM